MRYDAQEVKETKHFITKILIVIFVLTCWIPFLNSLIFILLLIAFMFRTQLAHYLIDHKREQEEYKEELKSKLHDFAGEPEKDEKVTDFNHLDEIRTIKDMRNYYRYMPPVADEGLSMILSANEEILDEAEHLEDNIRDNLKSAFELSSISYSKFIQPINKSFDVIVENSAMIVRKAKAYQAYKDDELMINMKEGIKANQNLLKKISQLNSNLIDISMNHNKQKESEQSVKDLDELIQESELYK